MERRRYSPPREPTVKYDTNYGNPKDPDYLPKFLQRTVGPVSALSKRQQAEWKANNADGKV